MTTALLIAVSVALIYAATDEIRCRRHNRELLLTECSCFRPAGNGTRCSVCCGLVFRGRAS